MIRLFQMGGTLMSSITLIVIVRAMTRKRMITLMVRTVTSRRIINWHNSCNLKRWLQQRLNQSTKTLDINQTLEALSYHHQNQSTSPLKTVPPSPSSKEPNQISNSLFSNLSQKMTPSILIWKNLLL